MNYALSILVVFSFSCFGATFLAKKAGSKTQIEVSDIDLPPNFEKSLRSGFTNVFVVQVTTWKHSQIKSVTRLWNTVVYDLWDENFTYKQKADSMDSTKKIPGKENIIQQIQRVQFTLDIPSSDLIAKPGYEISLRVIVDPISKEKKEKIRTWISENRVNIPSQSNTGLIQKTNGRAIGSESPTLDSLKTTVINQMIDSELAKEETEGSWLFESEKTPLILKDTSSSSSNSKNKNKNTDKSIEEDKSHEE